MPDDPEDAVAVTDAGNDLVTGMDIAGGFGGVAIDGDVPAADGGDRDGPASIEANGPQPQVEAHGSVSGSGMGYGDDGGLGGGLGFLATGAEAEEFEAMGDVGEAVALGEDAFEFAGEAFLDFDDGGAGAADEVVMVMIRTVGDEFEPGGAVTEIEPLHEPHFFEGVHVAVDGGEIAVGLAEGGMDLAVGEGMGVATEDVEDGLAWNGDLATAGAELFGEFGKGLLNQPMRMGMLGTGLFHVTGLTGVDSRRKIRPVVERMKRAVRVRVMVGPVGRSRG